jgi:hypothetical protein
MFTRLLPPPETPGLRTWSGGCVCARLESNPSAIVVVKSMDCIWTERGERTVWLCESADIIGDLLEA